LLAEEPLQTKHYASQEVVGLKRLSENESIPCDFELALLLEFVPMVFIESAVFFVIRCRRFSPDETPQIVPLAVVKQFRLSLIVEVDRCLTKVERLPPESVE
jgi:hypothetical protein